MDAAQVDRVKEEIQWRRNLGRNHLHRTGLDLCGKWCWTTPWKASGRHVDSLRDQTHAEGGADAVHGVETRLAAWPQSLVQGFPRDVGGLGDFRHAARVGDVAQSSGQQAGVVRLQDVGQIGRNGFLTTVRE